MAVVDVDVRDVDQVAMGQGSSNRNDESISLTQYYLKGPVQERKAARIE